MAQQLPDEILYDVRLIERHITKGLITRAAVEKRRAQSADMADQSDNLDLDQLASGANRAPAKRFG
jgi:hypothetical protein